MKKILLCLLIFISMAVQAVPAVINLNPTVTQFEVPLAANPSTGYQWKLKSYDRNLFNMTGSKFVPAASKLVGAEGTMIYTFQLVKGLKAPPMTSLIFVYFRPWEEDKGTVQTINVNFYGEKLSNE